MSIGSRERIVEADKAHVWHPYTPMQKYVAETNPLVVDRAEGPFLYDVDGRRYIDGNSSWWAAPLGHNHPRLVHALAHQAGKLCHVALGGITHEPAALCASELSEIAPAGLSHVFFSDNGSTAVESALKMCCQYWVQSGAPERTRFISLSGAFHGETLGASALSSVEEFRRPFEGLLPSWIQVKSPADDLQQSLELLEQALVQHGRHVAAIVLEPMVQGAAGMRIYPASFLVAAQQLARRFDTLLVFDEVFTGFGRTGPMWASNHADVTPDLMCLAKGLSGGMLPFAAVLANDRVFEGFLGSEDRAFLYGHTFCGNPLGARVAREVMAVYREEGILAAAGPKARRLAAGFERMLELPNVARVRTLGMVGALDLVGQRGYLERGGLRVYNEAVRRGAYMRPLGNVVYLTPPLNTPDEVLDELLDILYESVRAVTRG